ncbi:MAG TPA: Ldh family oxidoreductase, partial [Reyranella sp.]|nr:Ldh family oxidoreductase [Reyranella sp.]
MTTPDQLKLSLEQATALCEQSARAAGASPETALSLARSVVAAEADGQASVGLSHFIDYLEALEAGRIDGAAVPEITRPAPAIILSDAHGGAAHPGFDAAFDDIVDAARNFGLAMFTQRNAFTAGALTYFVGRLAERGLAAIAATNGPPLLAGSGSTKPVFCTNPMAFASPVAGGPPLIVDQASSATAYVNIRVAANAGKSIPAGWALDVAGTPTTDPFAAMQGALLAFGGGRGANIALMVEILSAGFNGASWSLDAPPFGVGTKGPGTGMTVIALAPSLIDPGFAERLALHLDRLACDYGVHIP